jgi:anti-sigma regulatory factor (Ser/Thr protein kinase)
MAGRTNRFRSDLDAAAAGQGLGMMRSRLRSWLMGNGVEAETAFDVLVAVGEACTNAVEHSTAASPGKLSTVRVEAAISRGCLRVRVVDHGRWLHRVEGSARANRGRGLVLMKALVDEVRISTGRRGTTVNLIKRLPAGESPAVRSVRRRRPFSSGIHRRLASAVAAPAPPQVDPALDAEPSPPTPEE